MRKHRLHKVFEAESVAVVGATAREGSVGLQVLRNLREAGYQGAVYPVNPQRQAIDGIPCYQNLAAIGAPVDLVVIAIPAKGIPAVMRQCVACGVGSVVIISAGFGEVGPLGKQLQDEIVAIARAARIPLVGPNCLGVIRPSRGLDVTFARGGASRGKLALVSQSGAFCTALLDAAQARGVGFSAVASLGATADIDFGAVLDYLSTDPQTRGILLYIEGVQDARAFLSGLRAAARLKPVIVVKPGRSEAGRRAAVTHTGGHFGSDEVFNVALERAGAVRVHTVNQLFSAASLLASSTRVAGDRLAIITNGGGPGVMAADHTAGRGVRLASLQEDSVAALSEVLPAHWSHTDPVDLLGDADGERYEAACNIVLADREVDGLLVLLTPQGMTDPTACAEAVVRAASGSRKPVLTCWMGQRQVDEGRERLLAAGITHFNSPEAAVEAFGFLAAYRRNQDQLLQAPPPLSRHAAPDLDSARTVILRGLEMGRDSLSDEEARKVLSAFHIPVTREADVAEEPDAFPVIVRIARDPVFGPVIGFLGGEAQLTLEGDEKLALPPLNLFLCRELIRRSRAQKALAAFPHLPETDRGSLLDVLMRASEMACELPEIVELSIDPLLVNDAGVVAQGIRLRIDVAPEARSSYGHMAIHPYPFGLHLHLTTRDDRVLSVRPIRPEDAELERHFVDSLSAQSRYFRFMYGMAHITPAMLARFTQIDYDREMALVALEAADTLNERMVAVARYVGGPDGEACEFALTVADDMQRQGVGSQMMHYLMAVAASRGYQEMEGDVLAENHKMLHLVRSLGFSVKRSHSDAEIMVATRRLP